MLRRSVLTVTTLIAALLSAAMLSDGGNARWTTGHGASLRVDRRSEHAAPWIVSVAPSAPASQRVQERQKQTGGTGTTDADIWTAAALRRTHDHARAPHRASPPSARPARHRVGFDATAPPDSPRRLA
jgi:hypothetical protein